MRNAAADVSKSIRALPGYFARLLYFGSLRDQNGIYQHWGLTREYGEKETGTAFQQMHRSTFEGFLQTNFSDLLVNLREHCERKGENYQCVIDQLTSGSTLAPADVEEHSAMHFSYVLASLLALSRSSC